MKTSIPRQKVTAVFGRIVRVREQSGPVQPHYPDMPGKTKRGRLENKTASTQSAPHPWRVRSPSASVRSH